jgi:hypothetical protein
LARQKYADDSDLDLIDLRGKPSERVTLGVGGGHDPYYGQGRINIARALGVLP